MMKKFKAWLNKNRNPECICEADCGAEKSQYVIRACRTKSHNTLIKLVNNIYRPR